jgi:zona occludens toxin (predicted ATPase)
MIYFFTGTPGSGKTYEAVKMIFDELRKGRRVYTNIDGMDNLDCQEKLRVMAGLDRFEFFERFHHFGYDRQVIMNFWEHCEKNSLVVIDEVQKFFSNRDWQKDENKKFGDWASTHRHDGFDLVMITQAAARVDSAVRDLVEWNYVFRKVNFFGSAVQRKYLCNIYADSETSGSPIKRDIRHYNSKVFSFYKSYVSDDIKEQSVLPSINVLKHPVFFAIPFVLGFCIYMIFWKSSFGSGDFLGVNKIQKEAMSAISPNEAQASVPPSNSSRVPAHSVKNQLPAPASPPIQSAKPITKQIRLNHVQIYKGDQITYRILYGDRVYRRFQDFPYTITKIDGQLYADIPAEAELNNQ